MKLIKIDFILSMLLLCHFSIGQGLSLDNIFKIYSLDSVSLKKFCSEKQFLWNLVDEDDWVFEYAITSNAHQKLYVIRTFPKDEKDPAFVRYHFDDLQEYKNFEDSIKKRGFARTKYKQSGKRIQTDMSTKYYADDVSKLEIGLEKYRTGPFRFALTLSTLPEIIYNSP